MIPSTLKVILPEQEYALAVAISAGAQYGRLVLVMDRGFCKDVAGNTFKRTSNSSFIVHFGMLPTSSDCAFILREFIENHV